jgi:glutathione S-transferase
VARYASGTGSCAIDLGRDAWRLQQFAQPSADEHPVGLPNRGITLEAQNDINRVTAIWRDCRKRFGDGRGDFLFGAFTGADAMFAPVVSRFRTYKVDLDEVSQAYADAVWALPAMQQWLADSRNEPMIIESAEF